jgi:hypothetical protein
MPNYNSMLASVAAMTAAPGVVQECRLGPPEHHKGPSGEIPFYPAIEFGVCDQSQGDPGH